jgi:hypothetical protein
MYWRKMNICNISKLIVLINLMKNINMHHPACIHSLLIVVRLLSRNPLSTMKTASWIKMGEVRLLRCRINCHCHLSSKVVQKFCSVFSFACKMYIYAISVSLCKEMVTLILVILGTEHCGVRIQYILGSNLTNWKPRIVKVLFRLHPVIDRSVCGLSCMQ